VDLSYVLPIRCEQACDLHAELIGYLAELVATLELEVIVADGSPRAVATRHAHALPAPIRHVTLERHRFANGKVDGVTVGVRMARHEAVVIADDDVRYEPASLRRIARYLRDADLILPQNVFVPNTSWHARWDTARSLLNRAVGHDYPGTLAIRRSTFEAMGGYDGDVLFENLELIRTVRAHGGRVRAASDLFVPRRPPRTGAFLRQRVRQAYDDLAQPVRLCVHLALLPVVVTLVRGRRWPALCAAAGASIALAEAGRRRGGASRWIPASSSWYAPAWLTERGICVWIAVASRVFLGGCRYRGVVLRRAATPMRALRRRAQAEGRGTRPSEAACEPSHSGFIRERPQRQSATTSRRSSSSQPSSPTTVIGPRTR
jgi:hypothetical protein